MRTVYKDEYGERRTIKFECNGFGHVKVCFDGEVAFDGSAYELQRVLESHSDYMDYIDNHGPDGKERS